MTDDGNDIDLESPAFFASVPDECPDCGAPVDVHVDHTTDGPTAVTAQCSEMPRCRFALSRTRYGDS